MKPDDHNVAAGSEQTPATAEDSGSARGALERERAFWLLRLAACPRDEALLESVWVTVKPIETRIGGTCTKLPA